MNINIIVAVDKKTGGIGKDGKMPWHVSDDLKWFKRITCGNGNNAVIMGRKTHGSIGTPLKGRVNIVLSRTQEIDGVITTTSLLSGIEKARETGCDNLFIIGGGSVYKEAIDIDIAETVYIDYIDTGLSEADFDTFFDISAFNDTSRWVKSDILLYNKTDKTEPAVYYRKRAAQSVDSQYLALMSDALSNGVKKNTRAGETVSVFGRMLDFDVSESIACLTTKKMYVKGCITELLWFLKGDTNIKYLIDNNCNIWTDDAYRYCLGVLGAPGMQDITKEQFIQKVKRQDQIHYTVNGKSEMYTYGDLGPVYGKQWTSWRGDGKQINQIKEVIEKLKNKPDDRRLLVSAWNVGEIDAMALPPCHYAFQLYSREMTLAERQKYAGNKWLKHDMTESELDYAGVPARALSLFWSQRSVDICLGLPYNMISYSILLYIIAQCVNMAPDRLGCFLGDCHIYENQIEGAKKQLERNPFMYAPPSLALNETLKSPFGFTQDDIKTGSYWCYPAIKFPLSVGL